MSIIDKYRDYLRFEKNYSTHTEISYYKDVAQFQEFVFSNTEVSDLLFVDADVARSWVVWLMAEGVSAKTVNRKLSSLKSFYRFLQKQGLIVKSPIAKLTGPKQKKGIPSFVTHSDLSLLLDEEVCSDYVSLRDKVVVELFYVTGIRRAELISLKDASVDLAQATIRVVGKRNKERIIPISDKTCKLLHDYKLLRDAQVERKVDAFFVKEDGGALYPMLVYRIVHEQLRWIPTLQKASPHVLRHSFATAMLNNRANLSSVKEVLGHASLASTEIYTHVSFDELKNIYDQAHPRA